MTEISSEDKYKVQIGIPAYNYPDTFFALLNQILNQTHKNLVIKICSNRSFDVTKFPKDKRIKYSENSQNIGVYNNTMKVMTPEDGVDFVCMISDDDSIALNYIEELVKTHVANNVNVVSPNFRISTPKNTIEMKLPDFNSYAQLLTECHTHTKMNHLQFGMWKVCSDYKLLIGNIPPFELCEHYRNSSVDRLMILGISPLDFKSRRCSSAVYTKMYDKPRKYRLVNMPSTLAFSIRSAYLIYKYRNLKATFLLRWFIKKVTDLVIFKAKNF